MTDPDPNPTPGDPAPPPRSLIARWAEMLIIFFGLPALVALIFDPAERARPVLAAIGFEPVYDASLFIRRSILLVLLAFTALIAIVLVRDPTFENRRLWNWRACKRELPRILGLFAIGAVFLFAAAWALAEYTDIMTLVRDGEETSAFLRLPRERPLILLAIAIGYPWVSAYPQEIVSRAFFFHRYRVLFADTASAVAVNAVAFAWLHALFWSVEALLLTLPGGVLFAITYLRTRSALAAGIEHALYGWWAFFVGFGWFVFTGSIGT